MKINNKRYLDKPIMEILKKKGSHAKWGKICKDLRDQKEGVQDKVIDDALKRLIRLKCISQKEDGEYHLLQDPDKFNNNIQGRMELVTVEKNIVMDIIEYLISEPYEQSDSRSIWTVEDIKAVLPEYQPKKIAQAFSSNQDIFEYIPGRGWRLRSMLDENSY